MPSFSNLVFYTTFWNRNGRKPRESRRMEWLAKTTTLSRAITVSFFFSLTYVPSSDKTWTFRLWSWTRVFDRAMAMQIFESNGDSSTNKRGKIVRRESITCNDYEWKARRSIRVRKEACRCNSTCTSHLFLRHLYQGISVLYRYRVSDHIEATEGHNLTVAIQISF